MRSLLMNIEDLPDNPPEGRPLGTLGASKPLGSLVQSARGKQLNQVRGFFIVIGILMAVFNAIELSHIRQVVHDALQIEINKNLGPGQVVDQAKLQGVEETAVRIGTALDVSLIFIGVMFIGLGLAIRKFPVAATLIGLILYIAQTGLLIYLVGGQGALASGIVFRLLIIFGLIKSLQTAIALQREERETAELVSPLS
jgi:hypothetical protein